MLSAGVDANRVTIIFIVIVLAVKQALKSCTDAVMLLSYWVFRAQ